MLVDPVLNFCSNAVDLVNNPVFGSVVMVNNATPNLSPVPPFISKFNKVLISLNEVNVTHLFALVMNILERVYSYGAGILGQECKEQNVFHRKIIINEHYNSIYHFKQ